MERKTMGSFIATLRKANGMTQKDLAERLNVSDKTVSRWEREDGAPDLSLIPVIAEIFGVTCDELLCGERKLVKERYGNSDTEEMSAKGEKQRKYLIDKAKAKYMSQGIVVLMMIFVCGILKNIINQIFCRAHLAAYVCIISIIVLYVMQQVISAQAWRAVKGDTSQEAGRFRMGIIMKEMISYGALIMLFVDMLPLMTVRNVNVGLRRIDYDMKTTMYYVLVFMVYIVVMHFRNIRLVKQGTVGLSEEDYASYFKLCKIKRIYASVIAIVVLLTLGIGYWTLSIYRPEHMVEKKYFKDLDSFIQYAEENIPYSYVDEGVVAASNRSARLTDTVYYDKSGNLIEYIEDRTQTLQDEKGTVLCQYEKNNQQIYSVNYEGETQDDFCVSVITYEAWWKAETMASGIVFIFQVMILLELFGGYSIYRKKNEKDLII